MASYSKDDVQDALDKINRTAKKHRKNLTKNQIPEFSSYSTFQSKEESFQEELAKFSEFLTENTREHSKVKSRMVYVDELLDTLDEFPPDMKMKAKKTLKSCKDRLKETAKALRKRGRNARQLIDSVRSMQTHHGKRSEF